jgi:C_GCAxxG_C_C family probable redox protein
MSVERAMQLFDSGLNCAQAVLAAEAPAHGLAEGQALLIATAFGGGMGRAGEVCGAITGALMLFGLREGAACYGNNEARDQLYERTRNFLNAFRKEYGSIYCRALLGMEISIPENRKAVQEKGLFKSLCPNLVRFASECKY